MREALPFKVVERGTGMTFGSRATKEGALQLARRQRKLRDQMGLHTNRIDVFELVDEEEGGPAL